MATERMSRDLWQLRIASADTPALESLLGRDLPVDGPQHAGQALLRADRSDRLIAIAGVMIGCLRDRGWDGDRELIAELEHYADATVSALIPLPVDLDQLGETLDESRGRESYVDLASGVVWSALEIAERMATRMEYARFRRAPRLN